MTLSLSTYRSFENSASIGDLLVLGLFFFLVTGGCSSEVGSNPEEDALLNQKRPEGRSFDFEIPKEGDFSRFPIAKGGFDPSGPFTLEFEYDGAGPVHAPRSDGQYVYRYSANGALESKYHPKSGTETYMYNHQLKLGQVKTDLGDQIEYLYDARGNRVARLFNQGGEREIYFGSHEFHNNQWRSYFFAGSKRIAEKDGAGLVYYYHQDHLGSTATVTDHAGELRTRRSYYEFGAQEVVEDSSLDTRDTPHDYNDKRLDKNVKLLDYHARQYSPSFFQFTQADTIIPDANNPQDYNRFAYVRNNPLRYVDPTGHAPTSEDYRSGRCNANGCTPKIMFWAEQAIMSGLGKLMVGAADDLDHSVALVTAAGDFLLGRDYRSNYSANRGQTMNLLAEISEVDTNWMIGASPELSMVARGLQVFRAGISSHRTFRALKARSLPLAEKAWMEVATKGLRRVKGKLGCDLSAPCENNGYFDFRLHDGTPAVAYSPEFKFQFKYARLAHDALERAQPGLVAKLYGYAEIEGRTYLIMEKLTGTKTGSFTRSPATERVFKPGAFNERGNIWGLDMDYFFLDDTGNVRVAIARQADEFWEEVRRGGLFQGTGSN